MLDTATKPIGLALNSTLLGQPAWIHILAGAAGYEQIAANQRPGAESITISAGQFAPSGGLPIVFGAGKADVSFQAGGGELLAIYPDAATLGAGLGAVADVGLNFPERSNTHFAMLRWPYDLHAAAAGAMALGAGANASFSGNAASSGLYALVREIADGPGLLDILTDLAASFRVPRQVRKLDDIAPGTWIIAEVNGSFDLSLTVTYGFDLSWIRQLSGGALRGDVALRILTGLEAQLGCRASGKYIIVLGRALDGPEARQIRLQLYQKRTNAWDDGVQAGVTLSPVQTLLSQDFDALLEGVLGIHGGQILKGFQEFEQWTNPSSPLFGPLANLSNDAASRIVRDVTGIPDLTVGFEEAKTRLANLFTLWNQLPRQAAALLWAKLPDQAQIQQIASFATLLSSLPAGGLESMLQAKLSKAGFLTTPAGMFLESIAAPGLPGVIGNAAALQRIQVLAGAASSLLNEGNLRGILERLQAEITKKLNIQQIEQALNAADLDKMDIWLEKRLEAFLGDHEPLTLAKLQRLREQLNTIAGLKDKLYAKALEALQKQYTFALTASCQSAPSADALVDLIFDFAAAADGAERLLALAMNGRFDDVLLDAANMGVLIQQGVLTHGIRRETSLEIALPFHDTTRVHVTDALAAMNAVDEAGGRLILYSGSFRDLVEVRNEWQSTLSIGLMAGETLAPGVVIHNPPAATYSYSLPIAMRQLTRARLKQRMAAELENYFPNVFGERESLDRWLDGVIGPGNNRIGNALLSLDVSLPPEYVLAWLNAPPDGAAQQYKILSVMLQRKFREFLLQQCFGDIERYEDVGEGSPVFTLLAFASAPCVTSLAPDSGNAIYWDYEDETYRRGVLAHKATVDVLLGRLGQVRELLDEAGRYELAAYYAGDQVSRIIASATRSREIASLFAAEARIIESARSAGLAVAGFQASAFRNPAEARKALATFGMKVVIAFHGDLENYATGDMLLPLGTLLFAEAARAFDPALAPSNVQAMFSLATINGEPFPPAGFPQVTAVPPGSVLFESRFVNVGTVTAPVATDSR